MFEAMIQEDDIFTMSPLILKALAFKLTNAVWKERRGRCRRPVVDSANYDPGIGIIASLCSKVMNACPLWLPSFKAANNMDTYDEIIL
jgi:hypothetical protein